MWTSPLVYRVDTVSFFQIGSHGFLNASRLRFMDWSDDQRHWVTCAFLPSIFNELYGGSTALAPWPLIKNPSTCRYLQQLFAVIHAMWRSKCVIFRGYDLDHYQDLVDHFLSIVKDPWLHGNPAVLSRAERRVIRITAPSLPSDTYIYFFDGVSRNGNATNTHRLVLCCGMIAL